MDNEHDGHDGQSGERNGDLLDARVAVHVAAVCEECRRVRLEEGPVIGPMYADSIADMVRAAGRLDDDDAHDASR